MRWFARRLVFYVFALWVALTINFLLPRLMPGSPIDGTAAAPDPGAARGEPGHRPDLPGARSAAATTRSGRTTSPTWAAIVHFDFGISTSNYPTPVSEVVGRTLPYSIFLVGVAFLLSFVIGTVIGMVAAWRRGGVVDNVVVAGLHGARRVPRVLHRAARPLLPRPQAALVPDPARVRHRPDPGLQLGVPLERVPPRAAADPRHHRRVHGRLGAEHAHRDDQHDQRGLRDDGARQGPARPPRDDALRGAERDPAAAERVRARSSRAPSAGSSSSSTSSATRAPA